MHASPSEATMRWHSACDARKQCWKMGSAQIFPGKSWFICATHAAFVTKHAVPLHPVPGGHV